MTQNVIQTTDETGFSSLEIGRCCTNPPLYEVTYEHIPRKWLVCIHCIELDFFKTNIQEKVRVVA